MRKHGVLAAQTHSHEITTVLKTLKDKVQKKQELHTPE